MAEHPERQAALVYRRRRMVCLWDEWKNRETGERLKSCTMIVGEPNEFAADIHDRMPVFLTEDQFGPWLSGEVGAEVLKPAPSDSLQRWPVSKRVNSSKADADDATLIERLKWPPIRTSLAASLIRQQTLVLRQNSDRFCLAPL